ncbi:GNAT family N-acetyltransferase [Anabaena sp. UHCC 0187]|uniref:GNAT family N-acetyltransferase n=1 Tax=unclassified Anabaena TaxID=2619674 RepID=UPI001447198A|nr:MULTISPECIES: GNAT family N-acetyltransferase [unclassified Anabaena]MDP5017429.1 GNAT family N-acetyltransferase [Dolichospermum sp.]MTJ10861.1 GNAT family N-acetyltransferase [Anabaena sp. UHCC 0204]MTJ11169.1 GNAT family N-acetyltransferase [Anabaena sp. UHCC 0187]MTJ52673.1 GNAT family N-acetyltransferase [Anabaena sp. UHCC 0253]
MTANTNLIIRAVEPSDSAVLFELVQGLAEYEKLSHTVTGDVEKLHQHLFGSPKYIEAILAEIGGQAVGFAMFFHNYSSYLTKPGIYLEDIYIIPEYRQQGIGKALLIKVAQIAVERDCGRLEWNVLDWNVSAQEFYYRMGAEMIEDWRICRLNQENLIKLANN